MKIKSEPEHFFVREISKVDLKKEGEYVYALLRKRNYTTDRAINAISRALNVSRKRIGYAGNKDKNALTEQTISIWKTKKEDIEKIDLKDIELKFLGYSDERICLGYLDENQFEISVFSEEGDIDNIKDLNARAKLILKSGIPNYFGEQRFGSAGNNAIVGNYFLKGDFENAVKEMLVKQTENIEGNKASEFLKQNWGNWKESIVRIPKWLSIEKAIVNHLIKCPNDFAGAFRVLPKNLRRIFIHAYQSYVWNLALSDELSKFRKITSKINEMKLNFPLEDFPNLNLPLIGFNSKKTTDIFFKKSLKIIEKEGLSLDSFKLLRMPELASEGFERNSKIILKGLVIEDKKDFFKIKFSLSKGSYATVVLRALFSK